MKSKFLLAIGVLLIGVSAHAQWEEWGDEGPKQNGTDFQNRQAPGESSHTPSIKQEPLSQQPIPEPLTEKDLKAAGVARDVDAVDFTSGSLTSNHDGLDSERLHPHHEAANKSQRLAMAEQKIAARDKQRKPKHSKSGKSTSKKVAAHRKVKSKTVAQQKHHKSRSVASVHSKTKAKKQHHPHSHMAQAVAAN